MISYVLNVDRVGDLKFGRKKCRLHKKGDVVKVAKDYGIPSANKKTVKELCGALKTKTQIAERVSNQIKKELFNRNNVPLAKLYPDAAKKQAAKKKRDEKKAFDRRIAVNFMKGMVTTPKVIVIRRISPKPSKKAVPLTKVEAIRRIKVMKGLNMNVKSQFINRVEMGGMSPRKVVKVAREISKL